MFYGARLPAPVIPRGDKRLVIAATPNERTFSSFELPRVTTDCKTLDVNDVTICATPERE